MEKKKSKIPKFKNIQEEAKFWDTHSFIDFEDEFKDVEIIFDLYKPKEETLVVRLQKNLKEELEKLAKRRGISLSTLARILLTERVQTMHH